MDRNIVLGVVVIAIVVGVVAGLLSYSPPNNSNKQPVPSTPLFISVADAYTGEASYLGQSFFNATGVQYYVASGGSFALARQIAAGSIPTTVFMSISDKAYYPSFMGNYSPGWAIGIATDEMVIAYTDNSIANNPAAQNIVKLFEEGIADDSSALLAYAFGNLTSGQVRVGISNPLTDPAGFRGWLVLQIAGYLYAHNESLYEERMLLNKGNVTATNAAELVPALETGNIQFLIIYKSFAVAKHLEYIELPPQLNFGSLQYADFYKQFVYVSGSQKFQGGLIILWISVPKNSNNPDLGFQFIYFTLNHLNDLAQFGMTPLQRPILENWVPQNQLPPQIQQYISSGKFEVVNVSV
jgi:molybdate/tungstate transport system substrate-binding protein